MATSYSFPSCYSFPPFFTFQPVVSTREKQFRLWKDVILGYCHYHKMHTLDVNEALRSPLFHNKEIDRKCSPEFATTLLQDLVRQGNAEWEDNTKKRCRIYFRSPQDYADVLYRWIVDTGHTDNVMTVFELLHGDDTKDTEFHDLDPHVFHKVLRVLEDRSKASVFRGSGEDSDVQGVKFFS